MHVPFKLASVLAMVGLLMTLHATAGTISLDSVAITTTHHINFDDQLFPDNSLITNQFAGAGLTFTGSIFANGCGFDGLRRANFSQNSLGTYGPGCLTNTLNNSFSMMFAQRIEQLSFKIEAYDPAKNDIFELKLGGTLVASFNRVSLITNPSDDLSRGVLNISGFVFDELRFIETGFDGSYLALDDLGFTPVEGEVPEPATTALLGLCIAGMALMRRKRRQAAA